jgi:hypothetical protein
MTRDTSSEQEHKQKARGRFQKGQSGNPGGRPKVALAWKERCRTFLEDEGGWEKLVAIAQNNVIDCDPMQALKLMCEYAYGKPQQYVDVTTKGEPFKVYVGVDTDRV